MLAGMELQTNILSISTEHAIIFKIIVCMISSW